MANTETPSLTAGSYQNVGALGWRDRRLLRKTGGQYVDHEGNVQTIAAGTSRSDMRNLARTERNYLRSAQKFGNVDTTKWENQEAAKVYNSYLNNPRALSVKYSPGLPGSTGSMPLQGGMMPWLMPWMFKPTDAKPALRTGVKQKATPVSDEFLTQANQYVSDVLNWMNDFNNKYGDSFTLEVPASQRALATLHYVPYVPSMYSVANALRNGDNVTYASRPSRTMYLASNPDNAILMTLGANTSMRTTTATPATSTSTATAAAAKNTTSTKTPAANTSKASAPAVMPDINLNLPKLDSNLLRLPYDTN